MSLIGLRRRWTRFWMMRASLSLGGRLATRLATWFGTPYYGRIELSRLAPHGFVSPRATISHRELRLGRHCLIGEGVVIFGDPGPKGGEVTLGDGVHLYRDITIQTGKSGAVEIGSETHVQPRCQFSAYEGSIKIGERVEIAPACAFYPYNHGVVAGSPVREQALESRGGIVVGDDVWLGYGVVVLDGVRIGDHAVVGAGAVVSHDIPEGAIAVGVPARVVRYRGSGCPEGTLGPTAP